MVLMRDLDRQVFNRIETLGIVQWFGVRLRCELYGRHIDLSIESLTVLVTNDTEFVFDK